jgi:putative lipoprotein (rSAM/lipoprotein system)
MKKVEIKCLKTYNSFIAVILALLGFSSSCMGPDKTMYGVPTAKFIVKGNVKSFENNKAIKDIKVVMKGDSAFTDSNGNYQVTDNYGFPATITYSIHFYDIDSSENGTFQKLDTTVEFINPQFKNGSGNWYAGETEKELDVKLKPK